MEGRRLAAQGMRSCRPRRRARCNSTILAQGQPDLDVARRLADGEPDALETLHRATVPRLRIVKLHVTTPRPRTMSRSAVTRRGASVHVRRRGSASCAASAASACVTGSRRSARGASSRFGSPPSGGAAFNVKAGTVRIDGFGASGSTRRQPLRRPFQTAMGVAALRASVLDACTVLPRYLPGARRSVAPSGHGADLVHALSSPALSSIEHQYASSGAKTSKSKNRGVDLHGAGARLAAPNVPARERPREALYHEPSQVPGFVRAGSTAIWPLGSDTPPLMLVTRLS